MQGDLVFNFIINDTPIMIEELLQKADEDINNIDYFICHQSSCFTLKKLRERLGVSKEKLPNDIVPIYGNSSSATIPVTLTHHFNEMYAEKDKLKINLPIGRNPNDRIKMAVTTKNSKNAITNIEVIKRYYKSNYTLVKAILETGRTHQIRVHMSYIKHPLVGDEMYGKAHNKLNIKGHLLHATTLGFVHPVTNKYVEFNEKLPEEFNQVLENLDNLENN
jgi:hypothetical protein